MAIEPLKIVFNYALSLVLGGVSGVRAFLPTFAVSLIAYAWPDWVDLSPTMAWLKHPAAVACSGLLALAEIVMGLIPALDNVFHAAMTAVHPVMGFVNALAPRLGDATAYTQGPMAVFGGTQALILHLLKILVRVAGCGCLGPLISVVENLGLVVLIPLAIVVGWLAVLFAVALLAGVAYFLSRKCKEGAEEVDVLLGGDPKLQSALTNYVRRHHSVLSVVYLSHDKGMSRNARGWLLVVQWSLQLALSTWILRYAWSPVGQDVAVAALLVPARSALRCLVATATACDVRGGRGEKIGPRAGVAIFALEALALFWAYELIAPAGAYHHASANNLGLVAVNFATSVAISVGAFEPVELFFVHSCCCCCGLDDDAILEDGEIEAAAVAAAVAQQQAEYDAAVAAQRRQAAASAAQQVPAAYAVPDATPVV